jgi:hypothetical protein
MLKVMLRAIAGMFSNNCPHCRSIEFRGVGVRNTLENAFHWLLLPYRCSLCGHHFFLFRWQAALGGTA